MIQRIAVMLCFAAALGCGGASRTSDGATQPAGECAPGGWPQPTEGLPEGCEAVHARCCYGSSTEACAAAGCAPGACEVLESYPAQIVCR